VRLRRIDGATTSELSASGGHTGPYTFPGPAAEEARMTERQSQGQEDSAQRQVVIGLLAAPGLPHDMAEDLAQRLPASMKERNPAVTWEVVVRTELLAGTASIDVDLVQLTRQRMLAEGWHVAICLTDLPVRVGRRPVTAFASSALGVGVVSVPAFGAVALQDRVLHAVLRLLDELAVGNAARDRRGASEHGPRSRIRLRMRLRELQELASPVGSPDVAERDTVRFVTAAWPGNLRLLLGMVRANRPWRLIIGLSRALVAALGTAAFGFASPPLWWIADAMSWPRLLALGLVAAATICGTLIAGHRLWEHPRTPAARERVALVNLATTLTVALGVLTMFAALLVVTTLCDTAVLLGPVLERQLGHPPDFGDYVRIAWLLSTLATIGGAMGAALETDVAVREAAYGYRAADDSDGH
jgi:hypothetical protein